MNKIFKVIWSKSKQCYVVVSEIAKNKTGKKKIVVAGIFAALAMVSSVQDVSAVTGSGRTNNFSNSGSGASFQEGEGLAIGTNATVAMVILIPLQLVFPLKLGDHLLLQLVVVRLRREKLDKLLLVGAQLMALVLLQSVVQQILLVFVILVRLVLQPLH